MNIEIHYEKEVTSTNTILKEKVCSGIPEGYVLVAESQTEGRGRLGRSFFSPPGSGLYFSILLKPQFTIKPASLTCLAAVAVAEAVSSFGISCNIKWVNDLYVQNKKAAGILTEGAFDSYGRLTYAIIGIGINLYTPDNVPEDIRGMITGIFQNRQGSQNADELLKRIVSKVEHYYELLPEQPFWTTYRNLLNCFGKKVSFQHEGQIISGIAEDIDREFRLIVRSQSVPIALERGEITFLEK